MCKNQIRNDPKEMREKVDVKSGCANTRLDRTTEQNIPTLLSKMDVQRKDYLIGQFGPKKINITMLIPKNESRIPARTTEQDMSK